MVLSLYPKGKEVPLTRWIRDPMNPNTCLDVDVVVVVVKRKTSARARNRTPSVQ
jgi:hypothetical protein